MKHCADEDATQRNTAHETLPGKTQPDGSVRRQNSPADSIGHAKHDTVASFTDSVGSTTHPDDPVDSCIRAENEDDDGYDPYSDRESSEPLFEPDPWD